MGTLDTFSKSYYSGVQGTVPAILQELNKPLLKENKCVEKVGLGHKEWGQALNEARLSTSYRQNFAPRGENGLLSLGQEKTP